MATHAPRREDRLVPLVPGRHAHRGRRARARIEGREGAKGDVSRLRGLRGRNQPEPSVARGHGGRREERTAGRAPAGRDGPGGERPRRSVVARRNPHRLRGTSKRLLGFGGTSDIISWTSPTQCRPQGRRARGPGPGPALLPRRHAALYALSQPYFFYANDHIASVNVEDVLKAPATKPADVVDLTPKFDENAYLLDWSKTGIPTTPRAGPLGPSGWTRQRRRSRASPRRTCSSGTPASHRTATFSRSPRPTRRASRRCFVAKTAAVPFDAKKLTDMNAQLAGFTLGTVELVSWKSRDGATIEGVRHRAGRLRPVAEVSAPRRDHEKPNGRLAPGAPARAALLPDGGFSRRGRSSSSRSSAAAPVTAARSALSTSTISASATRGTS